MKAQTLTGVAIAAFIAAIFFSNRQKAMTDAANAGNIDTPDNQGTAPDLTANSGSFNTMSNTNPTAMDDAGIEAIKQREQFSAMPYPDANGYSVGYGHFILPGEDFSQGVSVDVASQLLAHDVAWAQDAVNATITAPLTQNAYNALVSFCFNVGKTQFVKSTLARLVNAQDPAAVDEFGQWIYSHNKNGQKFVIAALRDRRASEAAQFLS